MSATGIEDVSGKLDNERMNQLKAFDETNAGVKGLVDAGVANIPEIFKRSPEDLVKDLKTGQTDIQVPVIDFSDIQEENRRKKIIEEVGLASEKWGYFQVVNHGIPLNVFNEMIDGACLFHEQDLEVKKKFYSRDPMKKVRFNSNFDLYTASFTNWKDTFSMYMPDYLDPEELPATCRKAALEYIKHIKNLGDCLFDLLSEALGLEADHLRSLGCTEGYNLSCHYYPPCPEPELTLGAGKHSDPVTLTVLLQSQISALQVLHDGQWVNVPPIPGALIVNIGDLLQVLSNDKLKSIEHRVVANWDGPRISVACFFSGNSMQSKYSPIKELTSESNPPMYREFSLSEVLSRISTRPLDEKPVLDYFKL